MEGINGEVAQRAVAPSDFRVLPTGDTGGVHVPHEVSRRLAVIETTPLPFVSSWVDSGHDAAWVHTAGELDLAAQTQFAQTVSDAQRHARLVTVDMRGLMFMDSAGVHAIIDANRRAGRAGHRLLLVRGPANVDRVLALTGTAADLLILDLDPAEPPVQVLLRLALDDQVE